MAIDLASSATVSTSTSTSTTVTIFDNPIPNHHHHQTTADSANIDFKSTSTSIKRYYSVECTMKLDSLVQQPSNGPNHRQQYHHHQKGFIEHIRRSITLGGGVTTSLQPLTKLWLFRRHSSLTKRQQSRQKELQVNTKSTSLTSSTTTKLDSNGNGASHNGVATQDQEVQHRLNGHSNGHHHHQQHQNLTNITSNDISVHFSSLSTDPHHPNLNQHCDSSSTATSSEIDEIASLDRQSTGSSVEAHTCTVRNGGHEHGSLDSGVVNNDNDNEEEEEEEVKVLQQPPQDHQDHHEDIEPDKSTVMVVNGGSFQYHQQHFTTSSSSASTIVDLEQLKTESSSTCDLQHHRYQLHHHRTKSEHSIVSCVSSTLEIEDDDEVTKEVRTPLQSGSNSPNNSDSGHGSMSRNDGEGDVATITPTPSPPAVGTSTALTASASASAAVNKTEDEEPLDDEQILESLRFVVRVSTRTDLSKRASIGEVFDRLDKQMRSLRPRSKPKPKVVVKPKSKRRQKMTSTATALETVVTVGTCSSFASSLSRNGAPSSSSTLVNRHLSLESSRISLKAEAADNLAADAAEEALYKEKQETTL